jgi:hypothetical protein
LKRKFHGALYRIIDGAGFFLQGDYGVVMGRFTHDNAQSCAILRLGPQFFNLALDLFYLYDEPLQLLREFCERLFLVGGGKLLHLAAQGGEYREYFPFCSSSSFAAVSFSVS